MSDSALDIAVLGAGVVGTNLARRFVELGHRVRFGARDIGSDKVRAALDKVPSATAHSIAEAVEGSDLALLAVPYAAVDAVLTSIDDPGDTILVDATNAVGVALDDGVEHIGQLIHARHPAATVVKAFNTIGAEAFLDPRIGGQRLFLPIAGPEPGASVIRDLADSMGFDALVIGGLDTAHLLESHAQLWIHLAFRAGLGRSFGFARVAR
jgi:predicted dinucleotide-binding enzyme